MRKGTIDRLASETGSMVFLISSIVLFLCAIGIMVWVLVDASENHMINNILYASAFLILTLGVLVYSLFAFRAPKFSTTTLWSTLALGVAVFIVGLCMREPIPQHTAHFITPVVTTVVN